MSESQEGVRPSRELRIAANLTKQPNFQAKVKLLSGEHVIQTKNTPLGLTGSQLTERIAQIQAQTRKNYCKPRDEVEKEIRKRQEKWHSGSNGTITTDLQPKRSGPSEEPPPTHY